MEQRNVEPGGQALSQDADPLQRSLEATLRGWLEGFLQQGLFRTLFQFLHKMAPWTLSIITVETIGSQDLPSPDRPVPHSKKRLGMLVRFLLAFVPSRFQWVLGHFLANTMWENLIPEEIRKMSINPSRRGSKRKQDDLAQEEQLCWVEVIQGVLPDEDDPEDSSYEPTKSEYESDEYKSQNDTETDLEMEERNGVMMLKEYVTQQTELSICAEAREPEGQELELRSSGDGSEHPDNTAAPSSGQGEPLDSPAAEMPPQEQEILTSCPTLESPDKSLSSDSLEQWVELSG